MKVQSFHSDSYATQVETTVHGLGADGDGFLVSVSPTIIYPGGGGQPSDLASIGGVAVVDVREGVDGPVYVLERPIDDGTTSLKIDWSRRYDHMQQHTSQHLLSHIFSDRFGLATASYDMSGGEIEFDRDILQDEHIQAVEAAANQIIRQARDVVQHVGDGGDRQIEIDGVGTQPCGGTHVRSTAELQVVAVRRKSRNSIWFLSGQRAVDRLRSGLERDVQLTGILSASPDEHVATVRSLSKAKTTSAKELRNMRASVAGTIAELVEHRTVCDLGNLDYGTLRAVAAAMQRLPRHHQSVLLISSDTKKTVCWMLTKAGNASLEVDLQELIAELGGQISVEGGLLVGVGLARSKVPQLGASLRRLNLLSDDAKQSGT